MSSNYIEQAITGRESLFRQKLNQLRTTGEIQRWASTSNQAGLKELEQSVYLKNIDSTLAQSDPRCLEKIALLDSLTEVYNHDTIIRMLKDEVKRSQRYKNNLCVLAVIVDSMDDIAKQGGALAYDFILKAVAQLLMRSVRDVDFPGRYDRDRFVIVCPETALDGAICLAKRLCNSVNPEGIADMGKTWHISLSIGISTFPEPAENDEQLLSLALQSLRLAEQVGGNTYVSPKAKATKMIQQ